MPQCSEGLSLFAYDTPGLEDGLEFYTPTVGEFLIDARFVVDVAFNGTTPKADIGATSPGIFNQATPGFYVYLHAADSLAGGSVLRGLAYNNLSEIASYGDSYSIGMSPFMNDTPLLVWASQNGLKGGTPVGGTTGAARLYILTSTPEPF